MEKKIIEFVKANINMEDVNYTYSKMCVNRTSLHYQNPYLYNKINDLVEEFCIDNDIDNEYFDIEEIFDKIMD